MGSSNETVIRPLEDGDYAQWCALWKEYLAFYHTQLPQEIYTLYFQRLIGSDPQDFNALVAVQNGELVGLVHFLYHRHGWKAENVCYLQDLFAKQTLRGSGIGRALIQAVYDASDANATPNVYWLTQSNNQQARKLYDRMGVLTDFIKYQRDVT